MSTALSWFVALLVGAAIAIPGVMLGEYEFHKEVVAQYHRWPIHEGTVVAKEAPVFTSSGVSSVEKVVFRDFYGHKQITAFPLNRVVPVGGHVPVIVGKNYGAYTRWTGNNINDPRNLQANGNSPFWAGLWYILLAFMALISAGISGLFVYDFLETYGLQKLKGRLVS